LLPKLRPRSNLPLFFKAIIQPHLLEVGFRGFLRNQTLVQHTNIVKQTIEKHPHVHATLEAFVSLGKLVHHFLVSLHPQMNAWGVRAHSAKQEYQAESGLYCNGRRQRGVEGTVGGLHKLQHPYFGKFPNHFCAAGNRCFIILLVLRGPAVAQLLRLAATGFGFVVRLGRLQLLLRLLQHLLLKWLLLLHHLRHRLRHYLLRPHHGLRHHHGLLLHHHGLLLKLLLLRPVAILANLARFGTLATRAA
jgi:hypothetical protein